MFSILKNLGLFITNFFFDNSDKDFIRLYLKDVKVNEILTEAEEIEKNSNQLLNYTNIIKCFFKRF